ncbi:MAG TPA: SDR family oxidoreductase [Candidatus Dormibacteraeota bacterium]|nr:SDR family oxidoreductase [Candidatus Dormibacteraeota bacterium]
MKVASTRPTVLITGAAAGMGRAHCRCLIAEGWNVVAVDRDRTGLASLTAEVGAERVVTVEGDVRQPDLATAAVEVALDRFGRLDGLVNNAGYGLQRSLLDSSADDLLDQLAVHVEAALAFSLAAEPYLRQARGAIVNVSSEWALAGPCTWPQPPAVAYCAGKAGVLGLTRALARQLAPEVRVNAIAPGGARTETTLSHYDPETLARKIAGVPAQRWAEPAEYSLFVRYLLSPAARLVTGQVLSPNGGEVIAGG